MYFYFIIILQVVCLYHCYKNRNSFYWYFAILLLPAIGCLIYVVTQIINRNQVTAVQDEVISVINPTKKLSDLEKKVAFSDTFQNRINLADALALSQNYKRAEEEYIASIKGAHSDDFYANSALITVLYKQQKYEEVLDKINLVNSKPEYEGSDVQFIYGQSLAALGKIEEAEKVLVKIDQRYSNYKERLILIEFYLANHKTDKAQELLSEMLVEHENMTPLNKKKHKDVFLKINKLASSLSK